MEKISVGILGIGAIGSVISSILFENKELDLHFFNRSPRQNLKIKKGDNFRELAIKCETELTDSIPLDWLIICLKEHQFISADGWFEQLIDANFV